MYSSLFFSWHREADGRTKNGLLFTASGQNENKILEATGNIQPKCDNPSRVTSLTSPYNNDNVVPMKRASIAKVNRTIILSLWQCECYLRKLWI